MKTFTFEEMDNADYDDPAFAVRESILHKKLTTKMTNHEIAETVECLFEGTVDPADCDKVYQSEMRKFHETQGQT